MTDVKELTILIALKIDSPDRLANLDTTIVYLQENLSTNIVICEQDIEPKIEGRYNSEVGYVFHKTDEFFNRQRGVNLAAKQAKTPVIAHYDADILISPNQIKKATDLILTNEAQVIYPYDGKFYDVPKEQHQMIKDTHSVEDIDISSCILFNPHSVGGVVFFDTKSFWEAGGANENFKGLGYEDNEIFTRFQKLGYTFGRLSRPLFHLTHERLDTSFNHNPYLEMNKNEFFRIERMPKEQLQQEVLTWTWNK